MQNAAVKIGWARTDITPAQPVMLRGQLYTRISRGTLDPITATALAIEPEGDADAAAVIVTCDLVGVPHRTFKMIGESLARRAPGFDPRQMFLGATHTHSAPALDRGLYTTADPAVMEPSAYEAFFVERVADVAARAWADRRTGGISWGLGHAVLGRNRRAVYTDGTSAMYGRTAVDTFAGFENGEDHGVDLLFTWNDADELTGMVVNVACPSQLSEHSLYVSADFWHEVRTAISRGLSRDVYVLAQCAAAGDQSPHLLMGREAETRMASLAGMGTEIQQRLAAAGLEEAETDRLARREEFGRRLSRAVLDVLPLARKDIRKTLPCAHLVKTLRLPVRMVTDEEKQRAEKELADARANQERRDAYARIRRATRIIERHECQAQHPLADAEIHLLRIGDIAMATNPFELYLEYGTRMKARSPAQQTFLVQLVGGVESPLQQGCGMYLPTERAVKGGSYSAGIVDNITGPEGGNILVEETVAAVRELWLATL